MQQQLFQDLGRQSGDVGANHRRFDDVPRMTDGRGEDFRLDAVIVEDDTRLADDVHPFLADIIEPSNERTDVRRACLGGDEALHTREAQRDVGADPFAGEPADGNYSVLEHRDLDDDVVGDLRERLAFVDHRVGVHGDDFGRYGSLNEGANLFQYVARIEIAGLFRQQRRIGGDAVDQSGLRRPTDVLEAGGVEEKLHGVGSSA